MEESLSGFVTGLGLPDWSPTLRKQVASLGAFMQSPCFPPGQSYPPFDNSTVQSRAHTVLQPLNYLLAELLGKDLSWVVRRTDADAGDDLARSQILA